MRSLYVVVVGDKEQVRRLTARMLADVGCRVAEAHSGAAALALLAGSVQVDLVVSDISMPGMSGEVLAARIGERWPAVLILLISGQGYPNLGFSGAFLPRPFTQDALLEASLRSSRTPRPDRRARAARMVLRRHRAPREWSAMARWTAAVSSARFHSFRRRGDLPLSALS